MTVAVLTACPHCNTPGQQGMFCNSCSRYMPDSTGSVQKVTHTRRYFGSYVLEGLLITVTLIVGWFIWLAFTAKTSQTPAKRLMNIYILDINSGQPITAGRVWVRDVLVKLVLVGGLTFVIGVATIVDSIWVLFDKNRQALHDKVVSTVVVYAPNGLPESLPAPHEMVSARPSGTIKDTAEELRELAKLREDGILTDEEYEAKRREKANRL